MCRGLRERGLHLGSHLSGPQEKPTSGCAPLSHTRLGHIPSLPEPALGGPASQPPHCPPPRRRPRPGPRGAASGYQRGAAPQARSRRKPRRGLRPGLPPEASPHLQGRGEGGRQQQALAAAGSPSSQQPSPSGGPHKPAGRATPSLPTPQSRLGLQRFGFLGG